MRAGQLPAPEGFEHWLIKFDGVGKNTEPGTGAGYGRIEYAYHLMANAAGITMSDCRLLEESGRAHFMTRRFDRDQNTKIHIQTLCAVAELDFNQRSTHAYSQYFQTVDQLGLGASTRTEAFRRMVFHLYGANCDDHTKNLSFLMTSDGTWSLVPAYDVTHAHNSSDGAWTAQHQMSVNGRFSNITLADVATVADRQRVPRWREAIEQVRDAVARWPEFAGTARVEDRYIEQIANDMQDLAPRSA